MNTRKNVIDFDAIEFPLHMSDNVKRFFYPEFMFLNPDGEIEYEQFCDIIDGKDRSPNAVLVLQRLLDPRYDRMPPKSFDIIQDSIEEDKAYYDSKLDTCGEIHKGVCVLNDVYFDFEYYVKIHNSQLIKKYGTRIGHRIQRRCSTVRLQGNSREYKNIYLHKACQKYFLYKSYNFYDELIKKAIDDEKAQWIKFRMKHKTEISEFMKSLSWYQYCSKIDYRIEKAIVDYYQFRGLEEGRCPFCSNRCYINKDSSINEYDEHGDFWFEIGGDKLGFKFLD